MKSLSSRFLASALAIAYFGTNTLWAYTPEKSFWTERRQSKKSSALIARVPSANEKLLQLPPLAIQGAASQGILSSSVGPGVTKLFFERNKALLQSLTGPHVTVRKLTAPRGKTTGPLVIHIQDVHRNPDAQKNIGGLIQTLIDNKQLNLVALEGAPSGDLGLDLFRKFYNQNAVHAAADYLALRQEITGPLHTALTSQTEIPLFVGVEEPRHYQANVEAYRQSSRTQAELKADLKFQSERLSQKKATFFSKELLALDKTVNAHHQNTLPLGDYVAALTHATGEKSLSPSVHQFMRALTFEKSVNFVQVEQERTELVRRLTATLAKDQMDRLLAHSMAYRAQKITYGQFYRFLKDLCRSEGVPLNDFPTMGRYIEYVLLSEQIQPETLFNELSKLETQTLAATAKTAEEKALLIQSKQLRLTSNLVDFTLTPAEWDEYQATCHHNEDLTPFEDFYKEAHIRDETIAENLLAQITNKEKATVLVTGGYHAEGIAQRLTQAGATVINVTPKIEKIDTAQGSAYLSVFSQEKTPLEKLFQKERLFLGENVQEQLTEKVTPLVSMLAVADAGSHELKIQVERANSLFLKRLGVRMEDVEYNPSPDGDGGFLHCKFTKTINGKTESTPAVLEVRRSPEGTLRVQSLNSVTEVKPSAKVEKILNRAMGLTEWFNYRGLARLAEKVAAVTETGALVLLRTPGEYVWFLKRHPIKELRKGVGPISQLVWLAALYAGNQANVETSARRFGTQSRLSLWAAWIRNSIFHFGFNTVSPIAATAGRQDVRVRDVLSDGGLDDPVTVGKIVRSGDLQRHLNSLLTSVQLNNAGGLTLGGVEHWQSLKGFEGQAGVAVLVKNGEVVQAWNSDPTMDGHSLENPHPVAKVIWVPPSHNMLRDIASDGTLGPIVELGEKVRKDEIRKHPNALVTNAKLDMEGGFSLGSMNPWKNLRGYENRSGVAVFIQDGRVVRAWDSDPTRDGHSLDHPHPDAKVIWVDSVRNTLRDVLEDGTLGVEFNLGIKVRQSELAKHLNALVTNTELNAQGGLKLGGLNPWSRLKGGENQTGVAVLIQDGRAVRAWDRDPTRDGHSLERPHPKAKVIWVDSVRNTVRDVLEDGALGEELVFGRFIKPSEMAQHPNALVTNVELDARGGLQLGGIAVWANMKIHANRKDVAVLIQDGRAVRGWDSDPTRGGHSLERPHPDAKVIWAGSVRNTLRDVLGNGALSEEMFLGEKVKPSALAQHPNALVTNIELDAQGGLRLGGMHPWNSMKGYENRTGVVVLIQDGRAVRAWDSDPIRDGHSLERPHPDAKVIWVDSVRNTVRDVLEDGALGEEVVLGEKVKPSEMAQHPNALVTNVKLDGKGGLQLGGMAVWADLERYENRTGVAVLIQDGRAVRGWDSDPTRDGHSLERPHPDAKVIWVDSVRNTVRDVLEDGTLGEEVVLGIKVKPSEMAQHPNALVTNVELDAKGGLHLGGMIPWQKLKRHETRAGVAVLIQDGRAVRAWDSDPTRDGHSLDRPHPEARVIWPAVLIKSPDDYSREVIEHVKAKFDEFDPVLLVFLATRYSRDLRTILWGAMPAEIHKNVDKEKLNSILTNHIIQFINQKGTDDAEAALREKQNEPEASPRPLEEITINQSQIGILANDMTVAVAAADEAMRPALQSQAVDFVKRLEEEYLFQTYYRAAPGNELLGEIEEKINELLIQADLPDVTKAALEEIKKELGDAKDLQDLLHLEGLKEDRFLNLFQLLGIQRMNRLMKTILADEMGLGKTLQALCAFLLSGQKEMVVVAPRKALGRWLEDIHKHLSAPLDVVVCANVEVPPELSRVAGIRITRIDTPEERYDYLTGARAPPEKGRRRIVITNLETMPYLGKYIRDHELSDLPGFSTGFIAIDEAHLIKNKNITTETLLDISGLGDRAMMAPYQVTMTGTPLENEPSDLMAYLRWLSLNGTSEAERFFATLNPTQFARAFKKTDLKKMSELSAYLAQRMVRRLKESVMKGLPKKNYVSVRLDPITGTMQKGNGETHALGKTYYRQVELYDRALKSYNAFERAYKSVEIDEEDENAPVSGGAQLTRLEQITMTPDIFREKEDDRPIDSIKMDAAVQLVTQEIGQGKNMVVMSDHRLAVLELERSLIAAGVSKDDIVVVVGTIPHHEQERRRALFQDGKAKIYLATRQTAGVSIELTNADSILFLNTPWTPSSYDQAVDRVHRQDNLGRHKPGKVVTVYDLVVDLPLSIDALKMGVVQQKRAFGEMIVNGNLSPEILDAFTQAEDGPAAAIREEMQSQEAPLSYERRLFKEFHLLLGRVIRSPDGLEKQRLWDQIAGIYNLILAHKGSYFANRASLAILAEFPELRGRMLEVLDLGSGPGTLHRAQEQDKDRLAAKGITVRVHDYDVSAAMLAQGPRRPGYQTVGSFSQLSQAYADNSFDVVNMSNSFGYAEHPAELIRTIHRQLKKGGILTILLPNRTLLPESFYAGLQKAGFSLRTAPGAMLESTIPEKVTRELVREYGEEFAKDIARTAHTTHVYLVARKESDPRGDITDEDFRYGRELVTVDESKIKALKTKEARFAVVPEEVFVEAEVVNDVDRARAEEVLSRWMAGARIRGLISDLVRRADSLAHKRGDDSRVEAVLMKKLASLIQLVESQVNGNPERRAAVVYLLNKGLENKFLAQWVRSGGMGYQQLLDKLKEPPAQTGTGSWLGSLVHQADRAQWETPLSFAVGILTAIFAGPALALVLGISPDMGISLVSAVVSSFTFFAPHPLINLTKWGNPNYKNRTVRDLTILTFVVGGALPLAWTIAPLLTLSLVALLTFAHWSRNQEAVAEQARSDANIAGAALRGDMIPLDLGRSVNDLSPVLNGVWARVSEGFGVKVYRENFSRALAEGGDLQSIRGLSPSQAAGRLYRSTVGLPAVEANDANKPMIIDQNVTPKDGLASVQRLIAEAENFAQAGTPMRMRLVTADESFATQLRTLPVKVQGMVTVAVEKNQTTETLWQSFDAWFTSQGESLQVKSVKDVQLLVGVSPFAQIKVSEADRSNPSFYIQSLLAALDKVGPIDMLHILQSAQLVAKYA